jgi:hypothetical protein
MYSRVCLIKNQRKTTFINFINDNQYTVGVKNYNFSAKELTTIGFYEIDEKNERGSPVNLPFVTA